MARLETMFCICGWFVYCVHVFEAAVRGSFSLLKILLLMWSKSDIEADLVIMFS